VFAVYKPNTQKNKRDRDNALEPFDWDELGENAAGEHAEKSYKNKRHACAGEDCEFAVGLRRHSNYGKLSLVT
jgi:hypothetical protein